MRTTIIRLVRDLTAAVPFPEPIYEVGAYWVDGHQHRGHVRDFLAGKQFIGCDLRPGPGVDEIQDLHALTLADDSMGTALLLDTIEHVREPWRAMAELHRCLRPGGLLLMTSHMFFPRHAHPDDYWRFTASGFASLLTPFEVIAVEECGLEKLPHTVVGIATKGPMPPEVRHALTRTLAGWKRRGASTWKEAGMALLPPVLLVPVYDLFSVALRGISGVLTRSRPADPRRG